MPIAMLIGSAQVANQTIRSSDEGTIVISSTMVTTMINIPKKNHLS